MVHKRRAYERILYDAMHVGHGEMQRLVFSQKMSFQGSDVLIFRELRALFAKIGFDYEIGDTNTLVLHSAPRGLDFRNLKRLFERFAEAVKEGVSKEEVIKMLKSEARKEKMLKRLAKVAASHPWLSRDKAGSLLLSRALLSRLFGCAQPYYTPEGSAIICRLHASHFDRLF